MRLNSTFLLVLFAHHFFSTIESIQFLDSNSAKLYNKQAFNLLNLLNKVNLNDANSFKAGADGNKQLQNAQEDLRKYLHSKDNMFQTSSNTTQSPAVTNISNQTFDEKFPNLETPGFSGDQDILQKIKDFNNVTRDFNVKAEDIRWDNSVLNISVTYFTILDRIQQARLNGSTEAEASVFDSTQECFDCFELRTEFECKNFTEFNANQDFNIVCCQCNKFSNVVEQIPIYEPPEKDDFDINFEETRKESSDAEEAQQWWYILIASVIVLIVLIVVIGLAAWKCCNKSGSQTSLKNSQTELNDVVVDDPDEINEHKSIPPDNKKESNMDLSNSEAGSESGSEIEERTRSEEKLEAVKMPQSAVPQNATAVEDASRDAEKGATSSCSSVSALESRVSLPTTKKLKLSQTKTPISRYCMINSKKVII